MLGQDVSLGYKHDWSLPKGYLLAGWVQYRYLAVILARRKLIKSNAETERNCSQSVIETVRHLHRLRFKYFLRSAVKVTNAIGG